MQPFSDKYQLITIKPSVSAQSGLREAVHSIDIETKGPLQSPLPPRSSKTMTFITRAVSAIAFSATLFASTAAFALTPFDAATQAQRGQLDGIVGHQALRVAIRTGRVTGEDILAAAGLDVNAADANFVENVLRNRSN